MAKVLSINAGSSSLKFKLFEMPSEVVITEGLVERIGADNAVFNIKFNNQKIQETLPIKDHGVAIERLMSKLIDLKIINDFSEISGVGHRVVHGGEIFKDSVLINDEVVRQIAALSDLAPLHNPANVLGIESFRKVLPNVPHVAVFDTSFHQTMPEAAYLYGTPYEWYEKYAVRKYGFHGTSHKYVSQRVSTILGNEKAKVIVCHLGNGASICAVDGGKSIDTSMGFTPLEGLLMGTRSGNIDPAIISYMMKKSGKSVEEIETELNKKSGLLGVSGISNDSRDIENGAREGNKRAMIAQEIFIRKIVSYISYYHVLLGGADAIAFTAGIGENSSLCRQEVLERLAVLGVKLNPEANNVRGEERLISTPDSTIKAFIIPTNEEVMIARDVIRLS